RCLPVRLVHWTEPWLRPHHGSGLVVLGRIALGKHPFRSFLFRTTRCELLMSAARKTQIMTNTSTIARLIVRTLLGIVSFQLAIGTQIAAAQTAPTVPAPADSHTGVTTSANGVPVINIATPNSTGVSHNRFNTCDVDTHGLILNNSATNAVS